MPLTVTSRHSQQCVIHSQQCVIHSLLIFILITTSELTRLLLVTACHNFKMRVSASIFISQSHLFYIFIFTGILHHTSCQLFTSVISLVHIKYSVLRLNSTRLLSEETSHRSLQAFFSLIRSPSNNQAERTQGDRSVYIIEDSYNNTRFWATKDHLQSRSASSQELSCILKNPNVFTRIRHWTLSYKLEC
jgi:hypothetical protein